MCISEEKRYDNERINLLKKIYEKHQEGKLEYLFSENENYVKLAILHNGYLVLCNIPRNINYALDIAVMDEKEFCTSNLWYDEYEYFYEQNNELENAANATMQCPNHVYFEEISLLEEAKKYLQETTTEEEISRIQNENEGMYFLPKEISEKLYDKFFETIKWDANEIFFNDCSRI